MIQDLNILHIRLTGSVRIGWREHVACMEKYEIYIGNIDLNK
jgi:hypothetical protein